MKLKCMIATLFVFFICLIWNLTFSQQVIELKPPTEETVNGVILKVDLARSTILIRRTEPSWKESELKLYFTEKTTMRHDSRKIEPTQLGAGQQVIVKYESEQQVPIIHNEVMPPVQIHTAKEIEVIQLVSSGIYKAAQTDEQAPSPPRIAGLKSKRVAEFLSAFSQSFDKVDRSLVPVMITRKKTRFDTPWKSFFNDDSFFDDEWKAIMERMEGGTNAGTGQSESEWMMVEASAITVGPQQVLLPNSLLDDVERIDAYLPNGVRSAEILAVDDELDLALLTVMCDKDTFVPCEWVDTDQLSGGEICAGLLRSSGGHLQFVLGEVDKGGSIPMGSQWLPYGATLFDDAGRVLGMAVLDRFEVSDEKGWSVRNVVSAIPASRLHQAFLRLFREHGPSAEARGLNKNSKMIDVRSMTDYNLAKTEVFTIPDFQPTLSGYQNVAIIDASKGDEVWVRCDDKPDSYLVLLVRGMWWVQSTNTKPGSIKYLKSGAKIKFEPHGTAIQPGLVQLSPGTEIIICDGKGIPALGIPSCDNSDWFEGSLDYDGSKYHILGRLKLAGWTFESDPTNPLIFSLQKLRGLVYESGKGKVRRKDGQEVTLGK